MAVCLYTGDPRPYGYVGLGELWVLVIVFFGLVATVGATCAGVLALSAVSWIAGDGVGLLVCALLVINNRRETPTRREIGKRTFTIRPRDTVIPLAIRGADR